MNWIEDIDQAEAGGLVEEQNQRMDDGEAERDIAGPVVQAKVIETVMRPGAFWAVAEDHQRAEQHVNRDGANGDQAEIGAEVEKDNGHSQQRPGIAFETVRTTVKFHARNARTRVHAKGGPTKVQRDWCARIGSFD